MTGATGVKIAWRDMLSLCEASCTLLRARSEAEDDQEWGSRRWRRMEDHRVSGWRWAGARQRDGVPGARRLDWAPVIALDVKV
jgi:hypothetical protein